jgi:CDP-diacylglycerol--glycerol-3-phosphate 3-phosphatidyltransferase
MNLPNTLTVSRIILAPIFFVVLWIPEWFSIGRISLSIAAFVIFLLIEVTDLADGYIARKYNLVTDLGKVMDPFSDVFSRLTYFVSFLSLGIMHPVFTLIILYREFSIVFIRMILAQRGIALAAKSGGKLKSVFYFLASVAALGYLGLIRFNGDSNFLQYGRITVDILFGISALLALVSFVDYLQVFFKKMRETSR